MAKFQIDVMIYGTVYLEAASAEEAKASAEGLKHDAIFLNGDIDVGDGMVLSSAMTIHGPAEDDEATEA